MRKEIALFFAHLENGSSLKKKKNAHPQRLTAAGHLRGGLT